MCVRVCVCVCVCVCVVLTMDGVGLIGLVVTGSHDFKPQNGARMGS